MFLLNYLLFILLIFKINKDNKNIIILIIKINSPLCPYVYIKYLFNSYLYNSKALLFMLINKIFF